MSAKCSGCSGYGMVGNMLDSDTCPFCKGSGLELSAGQESAAAMWDRFVQLLAVRIPLSRDEATPHKNFIGSVEKYRQIFLEANLTVEPQEAGAPT